MDLFDLGHQIGNIDSRVGRVEVAIDKVALNVETLLLHHAERRAERRMLAGIATLAGSAGAILISLALKLFGGSP